MAEKNGGRRARTEGSDSMVSRAWAPCSPKPKDVQPNVLQLVVMAFAFHSYFVGAMKNIMCYCYLVVGKSVGHASCCAELKLDGAMCSPLGETCKLNN